MTTSLVSFLVAFLVAAAGTPLVRAVSRRIGAVDRPDSVRKLHNGEVPLLGGIAIYIAFAAPVLALLLVHRNDVSHLLYLHLGKVAALMGGAGIALAMGIMDDVKGLPAHWKLLLQAVAATVAFSGGFCIHAVSNPFGQPVVLGLLAYPVTVLWFLACMNAVNLLDGLDGLAAGVCLFATLTLFLVSLFFGNVLGYVLMACLGGALLGFLLYNFYPASIFLGDSGSMLLGFLVAALSLLGVARKAEAAVALVIPVMALGLPMFDTFLAVIRRWWKKLPIAGADRQHIHHFLLRCGFSHRRAVLVLYGVCIAFGAGAVLVTAGRNEITVMVLGSVGIMAFVCVRLFGPLRFSEVMSRLSDDWSRGRRSGHARMMVEHAVVLMRAAQSPEALWSALCQALPAMELDLARLHLSDEFADGSGHMTWFRDPACEVDPTSVGGDVWFIRLTLQENGRTLGELQFARVSADGGPLPVVPELVERLRAEMGERMVQVMQEQHMLRAEPSPGTRDALTAPVARPRLLAHAPSSTEQAKPMRDRVSADPAGTGAGAGEEIRHAYDVEYGRGLGQRAAKGVAWSFVGRFGALLIRMLVQLYLARILAPEAFGLLGMAIVVVTFLGMFRDAGLHSAVVQRKALTDADLSTLFWLNAGVGVVLAALLAAAGPLAAAFYGQPDLKWIIALMAPSILFDSLYQVPDAMLRRRLEFGHLSLLVIASSLVAGAVSITMALVGFGVWSLVARIVVQSLVRGVLTWRHAEWRPCFRFSLAAARPFMVFGLPVIGVMFLNYFNRQFDCLVIGKVLGPEALGYYAVAYMLMLMPLQQFSTTICSVALPVFSFMQDDKEEVRRQYLRILRVTALLVFPVMTMIGVLARVWVPWLLGAKWAPAVRPVQILAPLGAFQALYTTVGLIFRSQARTDMELRMLVAVTPFVVASFLVGVGYGVVGVCVAYTVVMLIATLVVVTIALKGVGGTCGDFLRAIASPILCTGIMLAGMLAVWFLAGALTAAVFLALSCVLGACVYITATLAIDRKCVRDLVSFMESCMKGSSSPRQAGRGASDTDSIWGNWCAADMEHGRDWAKGPGDLDAERIRATIAAIPEDAETVLDAGCGNGWLCNSLKGSRQVFAVDYSIDALKHVMVPKAQADLVRLPFADRSFDAVICCEVLEHLDEARCLRAVRELARVARKCVIVTVPNAQDLDRSLFRCPRCSVLFNPAGHLQSFDRESLRRLFAGASERDVTCLDVRETGTTRFRPESALTRRLDPARYGLWPARSGVVCPRCAYVGNGTPGIGSRLWRVGYRLLKLLIHPHTQRRGRWVLSVYAIGEVRDQQSDSSISARAV